MALNIDRDPVKQLVSGQLPNKSKSSASNNEDELESE